MSSFTPSHGTRTHALITSALGLSLLLGTPLTVRAQESGSGPTSTGTTGTPMQVAPEVLQQLNPAQRTIVEQRMRESKAGRSPQNTPTNNGSDTQNRTTTPDTKTDITAPADTTAPAAPKTQETSEFEASIAERLQGTARTPLTQFGYDLFTTGRDRFVTPENLPVPDDYRVGAGDEISVSMTSPRRSGEYTLTVSQEGRIVVPNVGPVPVTGLTPRQLESRLRELIQGGATQMRLSVRLAKLRSIRVFVVGRVQQPGAYTVSALSTLTNVLLASGGPTKQGSLRDIQIKRQGKVVARFDLYDFLLRGDNQGDIQLLSGDVLVVPDVGPLVAIAGNVRIPGIYELKGNTALQEALRLAGRITPRGFTQHVQIERYELNQYETVLDLDLQRIKQLGAVRLRDGDLVQVRSIIPLVKNGVQLDGHVYRPGLYELKKNMTARDLLSGELVIKPEAYADMALIERVSPPDNHIEIIPFHLGRALEGKENVPLQAGDTVRVYSRWEVQDKPSVRVAGMVRQPGTVDLKPSMRVKELIALVGGLKEAADRRTAELTRTRIKDNRPIYERVTINLDKALKGDKRHNVLLQADDYLQVKQVADYKPVFTATLQGEVSQPGTLSFLQGERLSDVLARAGGLTPRAFLKGAIFTRESVKKRQAERIEEIRLKTEAEVVRLSAELEAKGLQGGEKVDRSSLEQRKRFLESLLQTQASGRMVVDLASILANPGSEQDLTLEDGDALILPPLQNAVVVLGQVYNPTAVALEKGRPFQYYLDKTGGPTTAADAAGIYVIRADGSVYNRQTVGDGFLFWGGLSRLPLEPGDTLVVPENLKVDTTIRDIRDITGTMFQITSSAALIWGVLNR
jgi:protein involved in polysaccharide export with SLBB domain